MHLSCLASDSSTFHLLQLTVFGQDVEIGELPIKLAIGQLPGNCEVTYSSNYRIEVLQSVKSTIMTSGAQPQHSMLESDRTWPCKA